MPLVKNVSKCSLLHLQLVAVNAEWMIDSIDSLSPAISKEWIALILLPTVGSLAGELRGCLLCFYMLTSICRMYHRDECLC